VGETVYIQRDALSTRVVLTRDDVPIELRVETTRGRSLSGNVYRGRVERIVTAMNAAFVDIGLERMGLLHARDVWLQTLQRPRPDYSGDEGGRDVPGAPPARARRSIDAMLEAGQEILVQVTREPVAKKGPRVTMFVTLPGRNLLFLARESHVGVSKRIDQPKERRRLRNFVSRLLPEENGAIVRTVGENASEAELANDVAFLRGQWSDVQARDACTSAPSFLFSDQDLVLRSLRDLVGPATEEIWLDNAAESQRIEALVKVVHPEARAVIRVHDGKQTLFASRGLDAAMMAAVKPRVSLPGGGDVVIERTEAMTVVDVNAGRRLGEGKLEDTTLRLNLAACREIARQLRLRNIGGLVAIDFVDMRGADDRRMVEAVFEAELGGDGSRVRLNRINSFGVMMLTRKRERESIYERLTEPCSTCGGDGHVRSAGHLAIDALTRLRRGLLNLTGGATSVTVVVPARVAAALTGQLTDAVSDLERTAGVQIVVQGDPSADDGLCDVKISTEPK